jgi:hypothetical protein
VQVVDERAKQLLFVGEVEIDGGAGDAGLLCDPIESGAPEAVATEAVQPAARIASRVASRRVGRAAAAELAIART